MIRPGRPGVSHPLGALALAALLAGAMAVYTAASPDRAWAQESQTHGVDPEAEHATAPVVIDDTVLFRVRGTTSYPAEKRAAAIAGRIRELAADRAVAPDALRPVETPIGTAIEANTHRVMQVIDADAQRESVDRKVLVEIVIGTIRKAVIDYRQARSREALIGGAVRAGVATLILAGLVALVIWLSRLANPALERIYRQRVQSVGVQTFQIVRAEQIWMGLRRLLTVARAGVILVIVFVYLQYALGQFPWTRSVSNRLLGYIVNPLETMGKGIVGTIPDVVFLIILFFVTRAVLKSIALLFAALGRGEVTIAGFDREWADPTYKLLRIAVVALALVVAYPYIPGSGSEAFKGISIFIGIVFSLGSSSAIANVIAGYSMTYRRAFRVGDRVKIGDVTGDVTDVRLQVTRLRTIKNEEVVVPNASILNTEVVNYSTLASRLGLILHTRVGIGYETPWRKVEAMLLEAADRTPGLMREPRPFVRQLALGDFAVTYEINVYCDNAQAMGPLYTALHRNILDSFNEHGVQIMTPAYEGDPPVPKVVPKDQWFSAPAKAAAEPEAPNP
jgi:small-conductance mechanosensitive channel